MSGIYAMNILSGSNEYIIPLFNDSINKLSSHFRRDERWYLDNASEIISLDENGGLRIPDVIFHRDLLLFSNSLKIFLDKQGIDYIFYKRVVVSDEVIGIEEIFWLVSVPRIDCIDFERTVIENKDDYDYSFGIVPFYDIDNPIIVPSQCGRYEMFRILGSVSELVYCTKDLVNKLKEEHFDGIDFTEV